MKQKKRVLYLYMGETRQHPTACEIYRGNMPIHFLNLKSDKWEGAYLYFDEVQRQYRDYGIEAWMQTLIGFDVFVFPRLFIPDDEARTVLRSLFTSIRQFGGRIVYEVDDDFTNRYRVVAQGDAMEAARMADAVMVSTRYLGRLMQEETGLPYYVLPNCLDPNLWDFHNTEVVKHTNKPVIGLTGSKTHRNDWKVLADVLPTLADKHDVAFIIMGYHPDYLSGLKMADFVPTMPYADYSQVIKACDIIVTPVDPNDKFNHSKSAIKAIEGMGAQRLLHGQAAGAAVVSTKTPVYSNVIRHEKTGLLVEHTPEAWYLALERLLTDTTLRHQLQREGYKAVWKQFDIEKQWVKWEGALDRILKQPVSIPIP